MLALKGRLALLIPINEEEKFMNAIDHLFTDQPIFAVPDAREVYERKMPGAQDAQGDHCQ